MCKKWPFAAVQNSTLYRLNCSTICYTRTQSIRQQPDYEFIKDIHLV